MNFTLGMVGAQQKLFFEIHFSPSPMSHKKNITHIIQFNFL